MFLSHNDGKTTATIKVKLGHDLLFAAAFVFTGGGLISAAITDGFFQHWRALGLGMLLFLVGCALCTATLRLIFRGWTTYENATRGRE